MKRKLLSLAIALTLLFSASGCALFEKEYTYSEPYAETLERDTGDATEISNYSMLKAAILNMINERQFSGELRFTNYHGTVSDDLAAVCVEIKSSNPLGAYAVDTLTYDSSRIISYYIAEIHITYQKTKEEIQSIRNVNSEADLEACLKNALLSSQAKLAVRTYAPSIDEGVVSALLDRICYQDPVSIPVPVTAAIDVYPKEGSSRIFELQLSYQESPSRRADMGTTVQTRIQELLSEPLPAEAPQQALEIANRLTESLTEPTGSYPGTAYGALAEHGADSLGIALAYGALCRAAGLDCMVVRGSIGAMGTEEHYWNILRLDEDYYHVDLSRFGLGMQNAFLLDDDTIWGTYLWDTTAYPACSGALRYSDLVSPAAGAEPADQPDAPPEETPTPETPEPGEEQTEKGSSPPKENNP